MVKMVVTVVMERMESQVHQVGMEKMVVMVKMVGMVVMVFQAGMARMGSWERRETLAPAVEGWCTLAGDERPAPTHQEQSWSTQEGLEGLGLLTKEELPTTSACLRVRTT